MKGLNKATLIGRLGNDPEQPRENICTFSMATTSSRKDKESDEWVDETEWHNVVFFGKSAEVLAKYLEKGSQVYVEGMIKTEQWKDKDGNTRRTTKIIGRDFMFLTPSGEKKASTKRKGAYDEFDDDIAF